MVAGGREGRSLALGSRGPAGAGRSPGAGGPREDPCDQEALPSPSAFMSESCWLETESLVGFQALEPRQLSTGKVMVEVIPAG